MDAEDFFKRPIGSLDEITFRPSADIDVLDPTRKTQGHGILL